MINQPRRYSWFYWFIGILTIPMLVIFMFVVFDFITHPLASDPQYSSPALRLMTGLVLVPLTLVVAILVLRRAPGNVCGLFLIQWALLIMSTTLRVDSPLGAYKAVNIGWVGLWLLPLYFPDGRASPLRFERPIQLLAAAMMATVFIWIFFQPTLSPSSGVVTENPTYGPPNPLFIAWLAPYQTLINTLEGILLFAVVVLIIPSLTLRYRASSARIRQQLKWLAWVFLVIIITAIPLAISGITVKPPQTFTATERIINTVWGLFITVAPTIAVGFAILHHKLYDIDIIIRRTLVYAILSGIIAAIYFGGIIVAQQVFRIITGQTSDLAIVVSTLLIAALFTPIRMRVQDVIDRRLYRRKYDAEKTLAQFNQSLRDEVNIENLKISLLGVVDETLQPVRASLWIRDTTSVTQQEKAA